MCHHLHLKPTQFESCLSSKALLTELFCQPRLSDPLVKPPSISDKTFFENINDYLSLYSNHFLTNSSRG